MECEESTWADTARIVLEPAVVAIETAFERDGAAEHQIGRPPHFPVASSGLRPNMNWGPDGVDRFSDS